VAQADLCIAKKIVIEKESTTAECVFGGRSVADDRRMIADAPKDETEHAHGPPGGGRGDMGM
jgi:hypothetical protein